jgi:hypothetical protein
VKAIGALATLLGGTALIISFFLSNSGLGGATWWHLFRSEAVIQIVLSGVAMLAAALAMITVSPIAPAAQAAIGIFLFGHSAPIFVNSVSELGSLSTDEWIGVGASLVMAVGGSLSLAAAWRSSRPSVSRSWADAGSATVASPVAQPALVAQLAPAAAVPQHQPTFGPAIPVAQEIWAGTKTCPDCAEPVRTAARVCRFCSYRFDVPADARPLS